MRTAAPSLADGRKKSAPAESWARLVALSQQKETNSMFSRNEGGLDRAVRILAGLGGLAMTQVGPQTAWGYIGLVPLITGLAGTCPLYSVFGWNTCPLRKR